VLGSDSWRAVAPECRVELAGAAPYWVIGGPDRAQLQRDETTEDRHIGAASTACGAAGGALRQLWDTTQVVHDGGVVVPLSVDAPDSSSPNGPTKQRVRATEVNRV
jgi:hypothetical protein